MKRFLAKCLVGLVSASSAYVVFAVLAGASGLGDRVPNMSERRGGWGQSLRRFREIDRYQDLDVLIAGSSHVYRGYDTVLFREAGLNCFNMGSTAQAPLNTHFLLTRYLPDLKPRIVLLDVYAATFRGTGKESSYDLACNLEPSVELFGMIAASRSLLSSNVLLRRLGERLTGRPGSQTQNDYDGESYMPGGFVATHREWSPGRHPIESTTPAQRSARPHFLQLHFLEESIRLCQDSGAEVVLVRSPTTEAFRRADGSHDEFSKRMAYIAEKHGCVFWDFDDGHLSMEQATDFYDPHHLSAPGAAKFTGSLIHRMQESDL
jgi:hypothetical protein